MAHMNCSKSVLIKVVVCMPVVDTVKKGTSTKSHRFFNQLPNVLLEMS